MIFCRLFGDVKGNASDAKVFSWNFRCWEARRRVPSFPNIILKFRFTYQLYTLLRPFILGNAS